MSPGMNRKAKMKRAFVSFIIGLFLCTSESLAHPGSGIVVDRSGNIFFVDTGSGLWKIDLSGKLTQVSGPAYHWITIDSDDRFSEGNLPYYSRGGATVARAGAN